jgi:zinc transport system substrate-binding protein
MKSRYFIILILALSLTCGGAACRDDKRKLSSGAQKVRVIASLFPLYDFAKHIGGERAEVLLLLPPGTEAHSFEPAPHDVIRIYEADIFIYTGMNLEPWVGGILKGTSRKRMSIVDASKGIAGKQIHFESSLNLSNDSEKKDHESGEFHPEHDDPHIWLDFEFAQTIIDTICESFIRNDPPGKAFYLKNAHALKQMLIELDSRYRAVLDGCRQHVFIHGGHAAFSYMAERYGLTYLPVYPSFAPDAEPTPQDLIALIEKLRAHNLKYVFYEELINPKVADTISRETGARLLLLHAAHNISREDYDQGVTFVSLMERNLENLRKGLECP